MLYVVDRDENAAEADARKRCGADSVGLLVGGVVGTHVGLLLGTGVGAPGA